MTSMAETVETLREAVTQLKAVIAPVEDFGRVGHFSPSEAIVLSAILRWDVATFEQIHQALYAGRVTDPPGPQILMVRLHYIRRALSGHGITIQSVYGRGYRMPAADKARLRQLMAGTP